MLYISIRDWVLQTPNTSWNKLFQVFGIKRWKERKSKKIVTKFGDNLAKIFFPHWRPTLNLNPGQGFFLGINETRLLSSDIQYTEHFWPAFGVCITQTLFEIYNISIWSFNKDRITQQSNKTPPKIDPFIPKIPNFTKRCVYTSFVFTDIDVTEGSDFVLGFDYLH